MPVSIQTVLQGYSLSSNLGSFAFCGITLIKGAKTTLVDTGHVGRRSILTERLKALGYGDRYRYSHDEAQARGKAAKKRATGGRKQGPVEKRRS